MRRIGEEVLETGQIAGENRIEFGAVGEGQAVVGPIGINAEFREVIEGSGQSGNRREDQRAKPGGNIARVSFRSQNSRGDLSLRVGGTGGLRVDEALGLVVFGQKI